LILRMTRREQILEQIRKISKVYLPEGTSVFIFGSQARLQELRNSDIDIGIQAQQKLNLRALWEYKEALNSSPNLYTFDVVDFNDVSESFKKIALRNTEPLMS
jgi:predicted nucleotidyltransferase